MQVIFDKLNEMLSKIATVEKKEKRNLYDCLNNMLNEVNLKITQEETLRITEYILDFKELNLNNKVPIVSSFLINRPFGNISYIYKKLADEKKSDFIYSIGNYVNIMFDNGFHIDDFAKTKDPLEIEIFKKIMESKKDQGLYFYKWIVRLELLNPDCECLKRVDCDINNYLRNSVLPHEKLDQIAYHLCSKLNESKVDRNGILLDNSECKRSNILFNKIMNNIYIYSDYYQDYHPGTVFVYNQIINLRKKALLSENIFNDDYKNIKSSSQKIISAEYIKQYCFRKIVDSLHITNDKEINGNFILVAMEKELLNNTLSVNELSKKPVRRI